MSGTGKGEQPFPKENHPNLDPCTTSFTFCRRDVALSGMWMLLTYSVVLIYGVSTSCFLQPNKLLKTDAPSGKTPVLDVPARSVATESALPLRYAESSLGFYVRHTFKTHIPSALAFACR
jgi:hypothetical protein